MHAVPEFARALLKPLGAPTGRVETFIEVPFRYGNRPVRPDGIIKASRAGKTWTALVETKTGAGQLTAEQIETYLDLARELEFDAVLSISNQYVSSSTEYPVEIDKRKMRRVALHHWSWIDILTEAVVQEDFRGVSDPDQAYILRELIRYLSDPRSGAASFEGMGPEWTSVRDGARDQTLRRGDIPVAAVAARWDDLVRYLGLQLTKELGQDVRQLLAPGERTTAARRNALVASLASSGHLYAELRVPNAAGPVQVVADLRARQITASARIEAPALGTSRGRVSWLLRQLEGSPDIVKIEARVTRLSSSLASTLRQAREAPQVLYPDRTRDIRQFVVALSRNMGLKRDSGRGSFVQSVISTTEEFYREVLQNIRPWKPSPPKLRSVPEPAEEKIAAVLDVPEESIAEEALPASEATEVEGGQRTQDRSENARENETER